MKKLLLLTIIPLFLLFLIFHDKGNILIKPYLSSYLEEQLENNMSLKIETLHIDYGQIKATAIINTISRIKIEGKLSLLNKNLDIKYNLTSKGFKNKNISFKGNIDINGEAKGQFDNIAVHGQGYAFSSKVKYTFSLKNKKIHTLKIDMDKANIEDLLIVMALPSYAQGKIDIHLAIPQLENNISKGSINVNLYQTFLNKNIFQKEFNLTLPPKTKLTATILSNFNNNLLSLNGKIKSNLGDLSFQDAQYHLKEQTLKSDYEIQIKELKDFHPIMKQKFYGAFALKGFVKYKEKKVILLGGQSKSLGGFLQISLKDNQFSANLQNIYLEKLLYLLGEKPYGIGLCSINVDIKNLKKMQGRFKLNVPKIETVNSTINKEFDFNLTNTVSINFQSEGKIISNTLYMKTKLLSNIVNIQSSDLKYHLRNNALQGSYKLSIPDLREIKPFIERPLIGKLDCQGTIKKDTNLLITGNTNNLGGVIDFKLKNNNLSAKINNTSVLKLMQMIQYPQTFNANIFGDIHYNIKTKQGKINTQLKQAKLLSNEITRLVKSLQGVDLTKERYNHSTFVAEINNKEVDFNFTAKSKTTQLSLNDAHLNLNNQTIHTDCNLIIQDKDISGTIKGDIHNPKLNVNTSNFIKNEIINVVSEQLDDKTLQEFGIGKDEKAMIKDIFDSFF